MVHGVTASAVWSAAQSGVQGERGVHSRGENLDAVEHRRKHHHHRDVHDRHDHHDHHDHHHGHHPRAGFGSDVMETLQSLGIDLRRPGTSGASTTTTATPVASTTTTGASTTPPDAVQGENDVPTPRTPIVMSGDDEGQHDGAPRGHVSRGELRRDFNHFVHALFRAVRREVVEQTEADKAATAAHASPSAIDNSTSATAEASGNTSEQAGRVGVTASMRSAFAGGLASLITDVSNGNAPSMLQATFDELMSDLAARGHAPEQDVSLQDVLTNLQQRLGYGATGSGGVPAVGQSDDVTA